jgi:predicted RNase H-like HicB family nuclease
MSDCEKTERELKHELANVVQQKKALQKLLQSASEHIEELVGSECAEENKAGALQAAAKFRRAAEL